MSCFTTGDYDATALQKIQQVREYLQVTSLAEICTADGKHITKWAWEVQAKPFSLRDLKWGRMPLRPTGNIIFTWQQALSRRFLHTGTENEYLACRV